MEFFYGFCCGAILSSVFWWRTFRSTSSRLLQLANLKAYAADLERRRDAIEFGNTDVTPPGAGPAGQENVLFRVRPGSLEVNRKQIARERVVTQPISDTLDYGSEEDHSNENDEG